MYLYMHTGTRPIANQDQLQTFWSSCTGSDLKLERKYVLVSFGTRGAFNSYVAVLALHIHGLMALDTSLSTFLALFRHA